MGRKKGVSYKGFTPEQYFWANTNKDGPIPDYAPHLGPCWLWTGNISPSGYGRYCFEGVVIFAHLISYKMHKGEERPEGLETDHLCRVRCCVNPSHIEAVTQVINTLRGMSPPALNAQKTNCSICSFPLSYRGDGHRYCKACNLKRAKEHYHGKVKPMQDKKREELGIVLSADLPQFNATKENCKRGHPLDGRMKDGRRYCKECNRVAGLARYHRLVAEGKYIR